MTPGQDTRSEKDTRVADLSEVRANWGRGRRPGGDIESPQDIPFVIASVIKDSSAGNFEQAREQAFALLRAYERFFPNEPSEIARGHEMVGDVYLDMKRYVLAEAAYTQAIELFAEDAESNIPAPASLHGKLGVVYNRTGRYAEAIEAFQKALDLRRATPDAAAQDLAIDLIRLSLAHERAGDSVQGDRLIGQVFQQLLHIPGEECLSAAKLLGDWAGEYLEKGKRGHAEMLLKEALSLLKRGTNDDDDLKGYLVRKLKEAEE